VLLGQQLQNGELRHPELRGQLRRSRDCVLDQVRVGDDVVGGLADREFGAVTIGDPATRSGDGHVAHLLSGRVPLERGSLDRAQVRRPRQRDSEKSDEDDEQDPDAAVEDCHSSYPPVPF
jgi:hypothetical protein